MSNAKAGLSYRTPIADLGLSIPMGVYEGISSINKFGRNAAVASGGTEEVWDGSAAYTFPAGALITKINTSADVAGMRGETVEVQGLDANWELVTQTADLDGTNSTTLVVLGTPLRRVFRMKFLSSVVGTSSITAVNDGDTVVYASIEPGNNQTLMAIYTVPAGKTAYMENFYATYNPGVGSPSALNILLWATDNANGYARQVKHAKGLTLAGSSTFERKFRPYKKFTEKTDIFIEATTVGAAADVSAGFDLILADNAIYGG